MMKSFASLVSVALVLTPIVVMALPVAQGHDAATQEPAPAMQLEASLPDAAATRTGEACRKVRVIVPGYGEPAGERCAAPRS